MYDISIATIGKNTATLENVIHLGREFETIEEAASVGQDCCKAIELSSNFAKRAFFKVVVNA